MVILATASPGFIATISMRYLHHRLWMRPVAVLGIAMIATSYVIAIPWRWISNALYYDRVEGNWQSEHLMDYIGGLLGSFYTLRCWTGLHFGIKYYQQLQEQTQATLKATAAHSRRS